MTFCFDSGGGGNGGQVIDDWWVTTPIVGGYTGPTLTTEQKLNLMLRPGDTYEFINNDPNQPQIPWNEEPINYASV